MPLNDAAKSRSACGCPDLNYSVQTVRHNFMPQCGVCQDGHWLCFRLPDQIRIKRTSTLNRPYSF